MLKEINEVLLSEEMIDKRVRELAAEINRDYTDKNPVFVGILKGSFVFMADLVRRIETECEVAFMSVSSYGSGVESSGRITIRKDLEMDVEGRHIIFVEDIIDSGMTLAYLIKYIANRNAASVKVCSFLDKPSRRKTELVPDYRGYEIPDAFVVGYGLDYNEHYRNLPYLGILNPAVYSNPL
jgi:hypoxanthine phosphoribosyltransferase